MAPSTNPKKKKDKGSSLFTPSDISLQEYKDLVEQVRNDFTESECQGELLDAARYGDVDVVRAILNVHPQLHSWKDASNSNTALHMSAANGHVAIVELLLQLGADASVTNKAGNTPVHWAAANGKDAAVQALLKHQSVDVLQQNQFGRSALTEGFSSENTDVVKSLLEHDSAAEERLVAGANGATMDDDDVEMTDAQGDETKMSDLPNERNSVTHQFVFQGVEMQARELAIAESDKDTILGQANPADDTTGLGIWAASLVLAQWLVSKVMKEDSDRDVMDEEMMPLSSNTRVVELGAGCGIPSLALARAISDRNKQRNQPTSACRIYATDFNPKTVDNLQHNIDLNSKELDDSSTKVTSMIMNWQDPSTWPSEPVDCVIGSDLIYQSDMVPLLVDTISGLIKKPDGSSDTGGASRFLYVARADGERQGHAEFLERMAAAGFVRHEHMAPPEYTKANPLASQDDDLCFLHFHELGIMDYKLFEFVRLNANK